MANDVIASSTATSDNDVVVNVNDYDNTAIAEVPGYPKEIQVKVIIKFKED